MPFRLHGRAPGRVDDPYIERLGRWKNGEAMPGRAAGVAIQAGREVRVVVQTVWLG